jgi:hypothetical protein
MNKGVSSSFHNVSTNNEKVIENNFSLKIHLSKNNYNGIWAPLSIVRKISIHRI